EPATKIGLRWHPAPRGWHATPNRRGADWAPATNGWPPKILFRLARPRFPRRPKRGPPAILTTHRADRRRDTGQETSIPNGSRREAYLGRGTRWAPLI